MKKIISTCLIFGFMTSLLVPVTGYCETEEKAFYVSPTGNDDNDGTEKNPFLTIKRAQEAVREVNDNMDSDITVYLREGIYRQEETLDFTEEDSGSNGYNVIWCGYNDEEVKISGGKQVTGWQKYDDKIWVADYDEAEYVRQLYVNKNRARRAQSEEMYTISEFLPSTDGKYKYDGIVTTDTKFSSYTNPEDIQLHFAKGWKSYLFNALSAEGNKKRMTWRLYNPGFSEASEESLNHCVKIGDMFYLENAFEELDREGEFYFNRYEKKLYYMPRTDENMETAVVEAAYLERLMDIKGENSNNKVHNIIFKGIDFAHATWLRPSYVGLVNDQAQWMHPDDSVDVMLEPGYRMVPACIQLDRAEKIQFLNNSFYDFGAVVVGMYQGVKNCKFIGNTFFDVFDSAITVGTEYQAYPDKEYKGYNLAGGKIATASSVYRNGQHINPPMYAIDSNIRTGWSIGGSAPHWWQVDLGEPYEIDRIEVDHRPEYAYQVDIRRNFDVLASNDPDFAEYSILASQGPEAFPEDGMATLEVTDDRKYRYVRLIKNDARNFYLSEVRIINESMEFAPIADTCKYVQIQNNYITRTSLCNYGAPAIQAYYVEGIDISHNYLYDLTYSGICVGWGWSSQTTSTACKDNKINYNYIEKPLQMCFDGGCIYTLGQQPNSQIVGNYVTDQNNHLAAIYQDQGSRHITIKDNVIENAPASFFCAPDAGDNRWENNYATTTEIQINTTVNVYKEGVNIFTPGDYPYEALVIIDNAGLQDGYEHLPETVGENLWPIDPLDGMNSAKIYHGTVMTDDYFSNFYLKYFVASAYTWLNKVKIGDNEGEWPQAAVDEYKAFLEETEKTALQLPIDRDRVLEYKLKFNAATEKFLSAKNIKSKDVILAQSQKQLETTEIGIKKGMVSQRDYDMLAKLCEDAKDASETDIKTQLLGSYLNSFDEKKVNLNISDVFIPNWQLENAIVDKEAATVDMKVKYMADYASLTPQIIAHEKVNVSPMTDSLEDGETKYIISTADNSESKEWTLRLSKPEAISSEEVIELSDVISDTDNWLRFGSFNCNNYKKHLYGDATLKFNVNIEERAGDWPSFVFRSQEYSKNFMDIGNSAYIMVFKPEGMELHRFNDGVRTQFYGFVEGCTTIFGTGVAAPSFVFGEDNEVTVSTKNTDEGVHIVVTMNGVTVFDFVDKYEGVIMDPGYIGTVSPGATVNLGGKS